ncbi:MAG: serine/threonine-protein kinase, partial [Limisphaerales bacterium]
MNTTLHCPSCGKTLAPTVPKGLCQECLLKAGFPTGTQTNPDDPSSPKSSSFVPPAPEELAQHFPQLEIIELIGRGGMGAVYKARQRKLDRIVALKILPPSVGEDPAFAERFTREAKALAKLNHPGIVTLYEFGETNGLFFFLMEFVDGVTLRQLLQGGRVSPREALAIVPQICDALQYAHDEGIVHRDIKPENILMDRRGRVKVADFGLAKLMASEGFGVPPAGNETQGESKAEQQGAALTDAGKVMGTPNYMAPEQRENPIEVDHRADIYALGVVFYQMLTGELPGKRIEPPSKKVQVDVRLDEVVLRALERNPERRYEQASILKTQVEKIASAGAGGIPADLPPNEGTQKARGSVKIPAIGLMLAGAINLLPLLVLGLFLLSQVFSRGTGMRATFAILAMPIIPAIGALVIWGATRMMRLRSFGFAVAAAILAMLTPPGFLLGFPFGVWALIVLSQRHVRDAFEQDSPVMRSPVEGPRLSRTAVTGAVLVTLGLLAAILLVSARAAIAADAVHAADVPHAERPEVFGDSWRGMAIWLVLSQLIGGICAIVGTLLGWLAVFQIRFSQGRLRGMPLALFDALVFPILILAVIVPLAWTNTSLPQFARGTRGSVAEGADVGSAELRVMQTPPFAANFPGGNVELIALAPHPSTNGSAWLPDGSVTSEEFPQSDGKAWVEGQIIKEIAFRIKSESGSPSFPVTRYSSAAGLGGSMSADYWGAKTSLFVQRIACLPSAKTTDLRMGIADGPWDEVITLEIGTNRLHNSSSQSGEAGRWEAGFEAVVGKAGEVALS